jgi:LTXXQ motif family protein
MTNQTRLLRVLIAAGLAVSLPVAALAQLPPGKQPPAKAAPAARPAPHAAPAPHIAAPPHAAAPHFAPAAHMAPPHPAPSAQVATPRFTPQQRATPHFTPQQHAAPQIRSAPSINRSAQQQQFRQERSLHRQNAERQQFQQERALRRQSVQSTAQTRSNLRVQSNAQTKQQVQLNTREQLRAERSLRRTEDRQLRRLPPSQRAERREQIQKVREQRALSRQQVVQPNALQAQSNARTLRANRHNGTPRLTADVARQGRFASRFAQRTDGSNWRHQFERTAAHNAWRHGRRAAFVAWYGPVFWPYAYSDVFDYAFWPYGYDDGFWAYAYDDFFDGVFWGEAGPPEDYVYGGAYPQARGYAGGRDQRPSYASVQTLCKQPGNGITAWPFADIEQKVGLNADQLQLLGDVRKASQDAAAVFKASCPQENAFPLTPSGRLAAMTARLDATLQAVQTVRPSLERFYDSLSDEQKERFNQIGPKRTAANAEASEASKAAEACKQPKQGLANLPIEKIEDAINPTDAQEAQLNKLQEATTQAVSIMQAACPDETPITPPGRLDVMEKRLQAMIDAAKTVKPALDSFYASLTSEQKARFNRIGQQLETTGQSSN